MYVEKKGKKQPKKNESTKKALPQYFGLCKGMAIAYAITCIVFLTYGILLTYSDISEANVPLVALICTAVSAAVAGFDWAKYAKSRGIFWGVLAGLVYAVLLFAIEGLAGNGFALSGSKLTMLLVAMAGGGIGGILGINVKK